MADFSPPPGSSPNEDASSDSPQSRKKEQRSFSRSLTTILGSLNPRSSAGKSQSPTPGFSDAATTSSGQPRTRRPSLLSSWSNRAPFTSSSFRKQQRTSPGHQGSPPSQQVFPPSQQVFPPSQQVYPLSQQVYPPSQQVYPPSQQVYPPNQQVSRRRRQVSSPSQRLPPPSPDLSPPSLRLPPPSLRLSPPDQQISSPSRTLYEHAETLRLLTMNQYLTPAPVGGGRFRQEQKAKEMQNAVQEKADRLGLTPPPYELLELIGKGSFGRVFKSRRRDESTIVAVKIIDVDRSDYGLDPKQKDQAIKDFINETSVLQTLKGSKAKNVNCIHEAFAFHSQLWIVSEYCPGGSVHTLMKASNKPGLEEKYIVAICRELALALKHVHEIDVIHRDVKAANVLITQDGQLQLCDFGVSGVLESGMSKRSTIIGTPYWMAPELHNGSIVDGNGYGTEIDCWAYGCTVFELATGLPPNAKIASSKLGLFLNKAPRLEGDYSPALKEFVSFCLVEEPEKRPTIKNILNHPYIADTENSFPTAILKDLIQRYAIWEQGGGQRHSLFNAHGAMGPSTLEPYNSADEDGEWNFSTTEDFRRNLPSVEPPVTPVRAHVEGDEATPKQHPAHHKAMTPFERAQEEERIRRGGNMMGRLFSNRDSTLPYTYGQDIDDPQRSSDLPLRNLYPSENDERKSMIDLDDAMNFKDPQNVDLADVPTVRAKTSRFFQDDDDDEEVFYYSQEDHTKRATREWKFPSSAAQARPRPRTQDWTFSSAMEETKSGNQSEAEDESHLISLPVHASRLGASSSFRPTLKHTATEPIGNFGDYLHPAAGMGDLSEAPPDRSSMMDLYDSFDSRPSTSHSETESSLSDLNNSNPFDLVSQEELLASAEDGHSTIRASNSRTSLHAHTQSAPSTEHPGQTHTDSGETPLSVHGTVESMRRQDHIESLWEDTDDDANWDHAPTTAPLDTSFRSPKRASADPKRTRNIPRGPMGVPLDTGIPRRRLYDPPAQPSAWPQSLRQHPRRGRSRTERQTPEGQPSRSLAMDFALSSSGQLIEFPDPMPPSAESLEENADPDVVASELSRLIGDFSQSLGAVGHVLRGGPAGGKSDSPGASSGKRGGKKKG